SSPAPGSFLPRRATARLPSSAAPVPLCPQDMNKLSCGKKTRVEGGQLGGDEWTRHGSFVNKPTRGWLHPDDKVMGPGVSYHVRYMGCVEVLQSMRALDFNTRTQVTREAIGLVCEAVPGAKGAVRRRKPCGRFLNSILGKSNLKFAGMPITLTISTSSLNLMASDCKQIIANHHMQSISFASGGDPDTAEYVAYVAKDPVNQRAGTPLCPHQAPGGCGRGQGSSVLTLRPSVRSPWARCPQGNWTRGSSSALPKVPYGGRVRAGGTGLRTGGPCRPRPRSRQRPLPVPREKLPAVAGASGRSDLFDDPSYVNVQNVDKTRQAPAPAAPPAANGSAQRDLFDMKPFEDALRAPAAALPPAQLVASMEEQLRREPWYHGKMSRKEAEKLLKLNGDFLVRESTTTPGQYVLTGLQGGQPKHLLLVDPEGVVRTKDHRFESVSHLISYHVDNALPIISAGSELCLQQPVERRP
ncbi:SHC1 protein, partial [Crypturellus soui]|nr:SHC1 protein [Crypturellus soui]